MDVFLLKVLGASLAFGLAVLNLVIMLQLYGKVRLFPWTPESLAWWHRRQGDVILVLFGLIAYHCVKYGYIDPASPRVLSHSVLGSLALAMIALKFVAVRWVPRWMERIGVIGGALFAATTGHRSHERPVVLRHLDPRRRAPRILTEPHLFNDANLLGRDLEAEAQRPVRLQMVAGPRNHQAASLVAILCAQTLMS